MTLYKSKNFIKYMSMLCIVCLIAVTIIYIPFARSSSSADDIVVVCDGKEVTSVTLYDDEHLSFYAKTAVKGDYRWQICNTATGRWINISGASKESLTVSYALVGSLVDANSNAYLRCRVSDSDCYYSEPVKVKVKYSPTLDADDYVADKLAATPKKNVMMYASTRSAEDNYTTYTIMIDYVFDNGTRAFDPYGANVAAGTDFQAIIDCPTVVGYTPHLEVDGNYVAIDHVELDYTNIHQNYTVRVVYFPAEVKYIVHHHLQDTISDTYSSTPDYVTEHIGYTGDIVPDGLAKDLEGFNALGYEHLVIAADGTTVIEIRYDRKYVLVDFDTNGGYGTEPLYVRVGREVGANNPIRHGYVFDGWMLVFYGDATPTVSQSSTYEKINDGTITVPAANLTFRAVWLTVETTYTMVFWKENADDNNYSYWAHLEGIPAMSGSYVDGENLIDDSGVVGDVSDKVYFTYNAAKTEKDVFVEGDGSTIVNVYYTRNLYTIHFDGISGTCVLDEHSHGTDCDSKLVCDASIHEHSDDCGVEVVCGLDEHEHSENCLKCGLSIHTEHINTSVADGGCISCTLDEHNSHSDSCCSLDEHTHNRWCRIFGCNETEHTHGDGNCNCKTPLHTHSEADGCYIDAIHTEHTDSCYIDIEHTHTKLCYKYNCNKKEHTHTSECYGPCCIPEHTHGNNCNKNNSNNVIYSITAKYDQTIGDLWPTADKFTDFKLAHWKIDDVPNNATSKRINMTSDLCDTTDNVKYATASEYTGSSTQTLHYMFQSFDQTSPENGDERKLLNGIYYDSDKLYKQVVNSNAGNWSQKSILGMESVPSGVKYANNNSDVYLYYNRSTNNSINYTSHHGTIDHPEGKQTQSLMYGMSLADYNFNPEDYGLYPSTLEANAYKFDGWYTTGKCYKGTEVDWDNLTVPNGNVMVYANWVPVTHSIKVYKDAGKNELINEQEVDHDTYAYAPDIPENGNLKFLGWFYMDGNEEKAFKFESIPVVKGMEIYPKWGSDIPIDYTINFALEDGTVIADPITGGSIVGYNKTFLAKTGNELYDGYTEGYYPLTGSHTVAMPDDRHYDYTFYYKNLPAVPYAVRYVDVYGNELIPAKVVEGNTLSVVTETFERIADKMPDAYQKRLILSAEGTSTLIDGVSVLDSNIITFVYQHNTTEAYYRVVHNVQNSAGGYDEYDSDEVIGVIGQPYRLESREIDGYNYKHVTVDDGSPITETSVTVQLTAYGFVVNFYYDRIDVDYVVHYVEYNNESNLLLPSKTDTGKFGEQVTEQAPVIDGYELVSSAAKSLVLSTDESRNVIDFMYKEKYVSISYVVSGPAEGATLSQFGETLKARTGVAVGSSVHVNEGFEFVGWFTDEACTRPVDESIVTATTVKPIKTGDVWSENQTYYAKVIAKTTELTINTKGTHKDDVGQAFAFRVRGTDAETSAVDVIVYVVGDGDITLSEMPIGSYTVTPVNTWSWRYENAAKSITLVPEKEQNAVDFDFSGDIREKENWLDANSTARNVFEEV